MSIRRTRTSLEEHYTQVDNAWARDDRLSLKARGLFVQILTHSEGWSISIGSLVRANPEGDAAIRSALAELIEYGYLVRGERERNDKGQLGDYEYTLWAGRGLPTVDEPAVDEPTVENPTTKKTIIKKDHPEELSSGAPRSSENLVADQVFAELWSAWPAPRRSSRKEVWAALTKALKEVGPQHDLITAAAYRHVRVWQSWPASEIQYVPLLPTWLNKGRWTAPDPLPRSAPRPTAQQQRPRAPEGVPINEQWMYQ